MELLFFLLASVGMCLILTDGSIFSSMKLKLSDYGFTKLVNYLNCPQCLGFLCGVFIGIFIDPIQTSCFIFRLFAYGCTTSLISYLTSIIIGYLLVNSQME